MLQSIKLLAASSSSLLPVYLVLSSDSPESPLQVGVHDVLLLRFLPQYIQMMRLHSLHVLENQLTKRRKMTESNFDLWQHRGGDEI